MDPVGITLGAVALLGPAIQACWDAYGVWDDTKEYGHEYQRAMRKLRSQRVILETLLRLEKDKLMLEDPPEGPPIFEAIQGELISMAENFETCREMINRLAVDTKDEISRKSELTINPKCTLY